MINIFNELYTKMCQALTSYDTSIKTASVHINIPSSYPFVSLEEINSADYERGSDCRVENFDLNEYEVNIYTKSPLAKSKADEIFNVIDDLFHELGFVRQSKNPFQNTDETLYLIVVRYSCVVSRNKVIYRR